MYRIFELIKKNGISQLALAKATGISSGNISDWKNGKAKPSLLAAKKVADYFGVSVEYLMGESDDPAQSGTAGGRALFDTSRPLTASEYEKAQAFINFLIDQDMKDK